MTKEVVRTSTEIHKPLPETICGVNKLMHNLKF